MKTSKWAFGTLAVAAALFAGSALAHGRVVVGVGFGFGFPGYYYPSPYYYPAYYPYPYYPPQQVVVQQQAPVYTERQDVNEAGYWYYCAASKGYYPYVKECPGGWQKVAPQPQN
jgi:hypothetical protein